MNVFFPTSNYRILVILTFTWFASIAGYANAFEWKSLETDKACYVQDKDGNWSIIMPCKSAASAAAIKSCTDAQGTIGQIGKQVVCRMPGDGDSTFTAAQQRQYKPLLMNK